MPFLKLIEKTALTFDDVLLVPAESEVIPINTNLETNLTKNIKMQLPILSAAMDKVTESKMAIKMAQLGGMGIIHKNMSPADQAKHVFKVKNFEAGFVSNPVVLRETHTLADYFETRQMYGFSSFPILNDSKEIIGFISEKDIKFVSDTSTKITDIMTPASQLITVKYGTPSAEAQEKMRKNKIEQVLVLGEHGELVGMVSAQGLVEAKLYPQATRDSQLRLRCGAAVGTGENEMERVEHLVNAGVDAIVVDTAHGHSKNVKKMVEFIKLNYKNVDVIAGNIATANAAKFLIDAGADCVKVGIGSGSICTTRIVSGVGVPQLSALLEVAEACKGSQTTFIADGGIKQSGDIAKAMACGSSSVMLGSLLAGSDETPGNIITHNGQSYKEYRGMGSISAMLEGSADRYFQGSIGKNRKKLVPEGVEARVVYKGALQSIIYQLSGGLRSAMGYTGCENIADFHARAQLQRITTAGLYESHVHSVQMVGDSPNYKKS
ncbi:MAG: IMP dehydrogenase [Alphaproteobacteria bacterium]|nr:IMP dehydrogenase [Alphaproteobacteria bacterium]